MAAIPASAFAQTTAAQPQAARDPGDQVICEKQEVIGSRLATKKVCMTRKQWAERQLADRQAVEKNQTQVYVRGQ
ncbi:hypothetical protein H8M03_10180 [Sphingomonas sabuli]|uniref:Uncharacterized protein n=1 Tax=Sphingomonas sabuli TaxID=2764186 RepID=A0A7G9L175_9SPHN|nr:hypothetical protein [Sphingomonas sabuli]QNM82374.1 hypothetical protein H8M03_10180 [Sphingomonas sabuli]